MVLEAIAIPPANGQPAKGLIVLLHGWGANFHDLVGLAEYMDLAEYQLVFPNGPLPHPMNPVGRMWYAFPESYSFLGTPEFGDRADLAHSRQQLLDFLKDQAQQTGIPLSRTVLGGFSQGGAMTLDVGVRLPLAGLMVLSGYLHSPLQPQIAELPPTLVVHGTQDMVVPLQAAHQVRDTLQPLGRTIQYQEYQMGHEILPVVLGQIQTFVKDILPLH